MFILLILLIFRGHPIKAIQEERVKNYFLTAAKELIRGEGLDVVTARNVAERAGYSYATLYNYFNDVRDLIFSCIEGFMDECREFVAKEVPNTVSGEKALIAISNSYVKFFIQYPGIFNLFFQEKTNKISTANSNVNTIDALFNSLVEKHWDVIKNKIKATKNPFSKAPDVHKLALHGILLFYLNNRSNCDYKAIMNQVREVTQFAIDSL